MREKEVHFIPQKRIESLLKEAGFFKLINSLKPISLVTMQQ